MNPLDVLLGILLILGMMVGWAQGSIRQILSLVSLYLSLILASYFLEFLGRYIGVLRPEIRGQVANSVAFLIIMTAVYAFLSWLSRRAFPETRLKFLWILDRAGGVVLSFFVTALELAVAFSLFISMGLVSFLGADLGHLFQVYLDSSTVAFFLGNWLSLFAEAMRPWLPGGVPRLFDL